ANYYLGCYIDHVGTRDLGTFIGDKLSSAQCVANCREQNFVYAAIQFGNECRCGQTYGRYGRVLDDECDYQCIDEDIAAKCGGDNRNRSDSHCSNNVIGYRGCFKESVLQIMIGIVNNIHACISLCAGFQYGGVLNGSLCYCGTEIEWSTNLNETDCTIPCLTNNTTCCGGISLFSVYDVNVYNAVTVGNSVILTKESVSSLTSNQTLKSLLSTFVTITPATNNVVTSSTLTLTSTTITESLTIMSYAANVEMTPSDSQMFNIRQPELDVSATTTVTDTSLNLSHQSFTSSTILPSTTSVSPIISTVSTQMITQSSLRTVGDTGSIANLVQNSTIINDVFTFMETSQLATAATATTTQLINIVYIRFTGPTFDPNNSAQVSKLKEGLRAIAQLAMDAPNDYEVFYYVTNSTIINGSVFYDGISNLSLTEINSKLQKHAADFTVTLGEKVQRADLSNITVTTPILTDQKLWLIGAIMGPIFFVILLILLFLYLHFKCRPRNNNKTHTGKIPSGVPESSRKAPLLNAAGSTNNNNIQERQSAPTIVDLIQSNPLDQQQPKHMSPRPQLNDENIVDIPPQLPKSSDIPLHIRESIRISTH
ncbi:unnamed protein product, partial [Didymodactylos carnosus]